MQTTARALGITCCAVGKIRAIRIARIPTTTTVSVSVKALQAALVERIMNGRTGWTS
jgi:hypothetical protein